MASSISDCKFFKTTKKNTTYTNKDFASLLTEHIVTVVYPVQSSSWEEGFVRDPW